ncbi:MAG: hypothetical protein K2N43_06120 [Lachnospiraceae bacterium]|nr:hypothetical protein [Lachnospiraceae bacterium]
MDDFETCMADVKNRIYEAGLFRPGENVVLTTRSCVLLEYFTGKAYSYRMVDLNTLKAKKLFTRATPLPESGYRRAMKKMQGAGEELPILPPQGQAYQGGQLSCPYFLRYFTAAWSCPAGESAFPLPCHVGGDGKSKGGTV